jgi:hypothetical protein
MEKRAMGKRRSSGGGSKPIVCTINATWTLRIRTVKSRARNGTDLL